MTPKPINNPTCNGGMLSTAIQPVGLPTEGASIVRSLGACFQCFAEQNEGLSAKRKGVSFLMEVLKKQ